MELLTELEKKAKKSQKKIVFPESNDERILKAASIIAKRGIARPVLIGNVAKVVKKAMKLKLDLGKIEIIDHSKAELDVYARDYMSIRAKEGLNFEEAKKIISDPIFFSAMMVHLGKADGVITGATTPTKDTVVPALKILRKNEAFVSSFFVIIWKKQVMFFADCGFNINPNPEQLATIAMQTALSAKSFGIEPKIAMLSFSTQGSGKHEMADKVIKATEIAKKKNPKLIIDGEMQFD